MRKGKPYRVIAAYDTETNNICTSEQIAAYPILHQFGVIRDGIGLASVTKDNIDSCIDVTIFRHAEDAHSFLDGLLRLGANNGFVPVVMVHNLGFDMHSLSEWLLKYGADVLAKSSSKPITFTIRDSEGKPALVLWDTLGFYGKSLGSMGLECGFKKLSGYWDYDLQRTPETPLSDDELAYSKRDIEVMFAYLGYYLRQNPDIDESTLALRVMTKTGAVREKRRKRYESMRGIDCRQTVGQYWHTQNTNELPKSDDELYTMHAVTRGGFTFCASEHAGVAYDLEGTGLKVFGYDATSQHPAQMVSHKYPEKFNESNPARLNNLADIVERISLERVLSNWEEPFNLAFNACFEFENLRFKPGTVFERNGISPLAWARTRSLDIAPDDESMNTVLTLNEIRRMGYSDLAENETHCFGKLTSAGYCRLWLTELAYWEMCQVFEWDSRNAICGYDTMRFCRPTDMTVLSVMRFYREKDTFKHYLERYLNRDDLGDLEQLRDIAPDYLVEAMSNGTASDSECKAYYQVIKSNLNALYGIEATREARGETILDEFGITQLAMQGLDDLPEKPKAWYQCGQRIVGWSRIAQIAVIELVSPYIQGVINGDTDSVKLLAAEADRSRIDEALSRLSNAIDDAKYSVTSRIKKQYPDEFVSLDGIGHYVCEFEVERFCAAWNKAYCIQQYDKKAREMRFDFTLAGVPTDKIYSKRDDAFSNSYNDLADWLYKEGWTFEEVCNLLLGYNVTIDSSITKMNCRKLPRWGSRFSGYVTDYLGNESYVDEPEALALYPMVKAIGAFGNEDNFTNFQHATNNNNAVNSDEILIMWEPFSEPEIYYFGEE